MNPTDQLIQKAERTLRQAIICSGCRRVFAFTEELYQTRPATVGDIEEIGFECPHCRRWHHICYLNDYLKKLRAAITDRNSRRLYQREFTSFQGKAAKRMRVKDAVR